MKQGTVFSTLSEAVGKGVGIVSDLLLPERCSLCGSPLPFDRQVSFGRVPVCSACALRFEPIRGRSCLHCGIPLISEHEFCSRCREKEFPFTRNRAVFLYDGVVREALLRYKVYGQKRLAALFARFVAELYRSEFGGLPVIPVPFRPASKKKRGWDQIETITSILSRSYGVPVAPLLRRRDGTAQKTLSFDARLANLSGRIFFAPRRVRGKASNSGALPVEALLLDDVFTTGATVSECARVLVAAGVRTVCSLTVAIDP